MRNRSASQKRNLQNISTTGRGVLAIIQYNIGGRVCESHPRNTVSLGAGRMTGRSN